MTMVWFLEMAISQPNLSVWGFVSSPRGVEGTLFFPRDDAEMRVARQTHDQTSYHRGSAHHAPVMVNNRSQVRTLALQMGMDELSTLMVYMGPGTMSAHGILGTALWLPAMGSVVTCTALYTPNWFTCLRV